MTISNLEQLSGDTVLRDMSHIKLRRSRDCFLTWSVCLFVGCVSIYLSLHLVRFGQLLRCADKRIVNIMKVYIERNNLQLELVWYHKKCWLYSCLLMWSIRFNAISLTEHISGSFEHKTLRLNFWLATASQCMANLFNWRKICSMQSFQHCPVLLYPFTRVIFLCFRRRWQRKPATFRVSSLSLPRGSFTQIWMERI